MVKLAKLFEDFIEWFWYLNGFMDIFGLFFGLRWRWISFSWWLFLWIFATFWLFVFLLLIWTFKNYRPSFLNYSELKLEIILALLLLLKVVCQTDRFVVICKNLLYLSAKVFSTLIFQSVCNLLFCFNVNLFWGQNPFSQHSCVELLKDIRSGQSCIQIQNNFDRLRIKLVFRVL